jgi:plasmid stabilization system protein ParE
VRCCVIVTAEAQDGIREAFDYIHERAPLNAARWLRALYRQIDTLERFPRRCPLARECEYVEEELRQLLFHSHRIVSKVDSPHKTVYVLHVRHAKQQTIGSRPTKMPMSSGGFGQGRAMPLRAPEGSLTGSAASSSKVRMSPFGMAK